MDEKICIIGAGPNGLASALVAIHRGYKVTLIDPWLAYVDDVQKDSSKLLVKMNIAKKNFRGSLAMYEYPQDKVKRNFKKDFPLSLTRGGLTSVWGANSLPWQRVAESFPNITKHQEIISLLGKNIPIESSVTDERYSSSFVNGLIRKSKKCNYSGLKMEPSYVAINKNACVFCGECLKGCTFQAIFNAEFTWDALIKSGRVEIIKGFANRLYLAGDSISVQYLLNEDTFSIQFDRIFIACGAIASTSLLQRSNLLDPEVQLQDSQVFYSGLIKLSLKAQLQSTFNLVQAYGRIKLKSNFIHLSIYEASTISTERMLLMNRQLRFLPKNFFHRIIPIIGFLPESHSQQITLKFDGSVTEIKAPTTATVGSKIQLHLTFLRNFFKFISLGVLFIPFSLKFANVGASYHVGKLQKDGKVLLDSLGRFSAQAKIHVVDSSSLEEIRPGPITGFSMFNSALITFRALEKVGE
jgi:ferredoxin